MALTKAQRYVGDLSTAEKATVKFEESERKAKIRYNGEIHTDGEGKKGPIFKLEADEEGERAGKMTVDVDEHFNAIFIEDRDGIQTTQEPL